MPADNFPHDAAYKAFFSNPDMVKSLLVDFVPQEIIRDFNLDTLEQCSGSYTTPELQQRHDDIVWRLRYKGDWCYIYLILEFQSTQDYWMALRILTYTALLWEDLVKNGYVKTGQKLPPIFPIVIYNGDTPWNASLNIDDLVESTDDELSDYQPSQKYFLLDENRISNLLLDNANGESAYIFRFERAKNGVEFTALMEEIKQRLSNPKYDLLRRALYVWIDRLMVKRNIHIDEYKEEPEIPPGEEIEMLEQKFRKWEQEYIQQGIIQGKAEGISEGIIQGKAEGIAQGITNQKATLLEMLSDRFGEIPASWQNAISQINDPVFLSQLTRAILKAKTSEDYGNILLERQNKR